MPDYKNRDEYIKQAKQRATQGMIKRATQKLKMPKSYSAPRQTILPPTRPPIPAYMTHPMDISHFIPKAGRFPLPPTKQKARKKPLTRDQLRLHPNYQKKYKLPTSRD